jgi:hypothetical protein
MCPYFGKSRMLVFASSSHCVEVICCPKVVTEKNIIANIRIFFIGLDCFNLLTFCRFATGDIFSTKVYAEHCTLVTTKLSAEYEIPAIANVLLKPVVLFDVVRRV